MKNLIRWSNYDCRARLGRYGNNRLAIRLEAADTEHNHEQDVLPGEAIATATVNIPEQPLGASETFIKDWQENKGILQALTQAGIVKPTGNHSTCKLKAPIVQVIPEKLLPL